MPKKAPAPERPQQSTGEAGEGAAPVERITVQERQNPALHWQIICYRKYNAVRGLYCVLGMAAGLCHIRFISWVCCSAPVPVAHPLAPRTPWLLQLLTDPLQSDAAWQLLHALGQSTALQNKGVTMSSPTGSQFVSSGMSKSWKVNSFLYNRDFKTIALCFGSARMPRETKQWAICASFPPSLVSALWI